MKQQTLTVEDAKTTAKMLSEALPYLQRFEDAVVVVKFGGNAMGDDAAMAEFARDIVLMKQVRGLTTGARRGHSDKSEHAGHRSRTGQAIFFRSH